MKTEIICAGFGGQGVLTTGKLISSCLVSSGKNITWIPKYSSEMRGGEANCFIKYSDEEIYSPYVEEADILVAFNEHGLEKFEKSVKPGGHIFVNSSIVKEDRTFRDDITVIGVPMTEIALENENPRGANLVLLGALDQKTHLIEPQVFRDNIDAFFAKKGKYNEKNGICFDAGFQFAEKH